MRSGQVNQFPILLSLNARCILSQYCTTLDICYFLPHFLAVSKTNRQVCKTHEFIHGVEALYPRTVLWTISPVGGCLGLVYFLITDPYYTNELVSIRAFVSHAIRSCGSLNAQLGYRVTCCSTFDSIDDVLSRSPYVDKSFLDIKP